MFVLSRLSYSFACQLSRAQNDSPASVCTEAFSQVNDAFVRMAAQLAFVGALIVVLKKLKWS